MEGLEVNNTPSKGGVSESVCFALWNGEAAQRGR